MVVQMCLQLLLTGLLAGLVAADPSWIHRKSGRASWEPTVRGWGTQTERAAGSNPNRHFDTVVSFGDSFSDTHNMFAMYGTPTPPYLDGRFSNGPLWTEHLATLIGAHTLVNLAFSGSTANSTDSVEELLKLTGLKPVFNFHTPDLPEQLSLLRVSPSASLLHSNKTLVTLFAGANDFAFTLLELQTPDAPRVAGYVVSMVRNLVEAGARNVAVLNMPPLQFTPVGRLFSVAQDFVEALVESYNKVLGDGLDAIKAANSNATITTVDLNKLLTYTLTPEGMQYFNLTDVSNMCFNQLTVCSSPDTYMFWDYLHPTTRGHEVVAQTAYNAINGNSGFGPSSPVDGLGGTPGGNSTFTTVSIHPASKDESMGVGTVATATVPSVGPSKTSGSADNHFHCQAVFIFAAFFLA
ncbi:SGNH hydrolase-type esterase domain-containing protein [Chytriomyces sp. MP71]|nr:SGNH hydrolase-type esterase domain-containing protein [Chytriomyces sp. MP71]